MADFFGRALSSIGIGTYLGKDDDATDRDYEAAIARAIERGVNVVDTAINYRSQRSERAVGRVLARLFQEKKLSRDDVFVTTKGGFLPFDGTRPASARAYFEQTYLSTGVLRPEDIVGGCHAMTPRYLSDQLERSKKNLGLAKIDVYYLHNLEMQLDEVPRPEFEKRVRLAFEMLEGAKSRGVIGCYGTATWNGYRAPANDPGHLSLDRLLSIAREVGGETHGFRMVQLPVNLSMQEAITSKNQTREGVPATLLEAAKDRVYVMTSGSILQGKLAANGGAKKALDFVRSTPGVGTALVGMKQTAHVDENVG